jgi:4-hydroxyphenylpyruvate dioxygenase
MTTPTAPPHRSIATVCLSGTLEDKVTAAAAAGFDGIEVFEPDLIASPWTPAELAARCADLGLTIDLYQPFRDLDSTDPDRFARNLRRIERKFDVMTQLGTSTALVCSSVAPDAVADLGRLAEQLAVAADRAAGRGLRIAYEALAWGRHIWTWDRSWEAVRRAAHPALGLCLDSFHVLSRDGDPVGFAAVDPDKIFFLQLAGAPHLEMDVLQSSRHHHRLFPGQGAFDLPGFLAHVLDAGYEGPLSLEVFNDVFRQADPARTAVDPMRSLLWLEDQVAAERPDLGLPARTAAPHRRTRSWPSWSSATPNGMFPTPEETASLATDSPGGRWRSSRIAPIRRSGGGSADSARAVTRSAVAGMGTPCTTTPSR